MQKCPHWTDRFPNGLPSHLFPISDIGKNLGQFSVDKPLVFELQDWLFRGVPTYPTLPTSLDLSYKQLNIETTEAHEKYDSTIFFNFRLYLQLDQLEAHRKIHTGEAPYKCGQCNKTFCHVDNLNKHVASHTTEKLYKCKLCDEHFTLRYVFQIYNWADDCYFQVWNQIPLGVKY